MRIFPDKQRSIGTKGLPQIAYRLGNSGNMSSREAAVSGLPPVTGCPKPHLAFRIRYIRNNVGVGISNCLQIDVIFFSDFRTC